MTIGGWVGFIVASIIWVFICICFCVDYDDNKAARALVISITIVLIVATFVGINAYYNHTASGKRALRDQKSNFHNGVERVIKQIDDCGNVIFEFKGKIDVETDHDGDGGSDYILWDDEDGIRHILYKSATTTLLIEDV